MKRKMLVCLVLIVSACGTEEQEAEAEEVRATAIEKQTTVLENRFSPDFIKCDESDRPCRIKVLCGQESCNIFSGYGIAKLKENEYTFVGPEYGIPGPQKLRIQEYTLDLTAAIDIQYEYYPNGRPNSGTICANESSRC